MPVRPVHESSEYIDSYNGTLYGKYGEEERSFSTGYVLIDDRRAPC